MPVLSTWAVLHGTVHDEEEVDGVINQLREEWNCIRENTRKNSVQAKVDALKRIACHSWRRKVEPPSPTPHNWHGVILWENGWLLYHTVSCS